MSLHRPEATLRSTTVRVGLSVWSVVWLLAAVAASDGSQVDSAHILRGDVTIETDSMGRVLVAVDSDRPQAPPDGWVDELFILQTEPDVAASIGRDTAPAEVLYRDGFLQVRSDAGEVLIFTLPKEVHRSRRWPEAIQVVGFGLARYTGDFAERVASPTAREVIAAFSDPETPVHRSGGAPAEARSGGPADLPCPDGG